MDKYEYNIKAEQIVKLIGKKDFNTAAKIADGIDWKRVRNINMLMNIGGVYTEVGRYSDAKVILQLAFERAPIGRRIAYKLAEVCIMAGDFEDAEHYYQNFVDLAPRDIGRYELQYKLAKKKGEPVEKLITILQEYKKNDFDEAWAYELAKLYHKAGMRDACIAECDELILWFGEGEYVEKAMELKMLYTSLSPSQQEKYNKRFQPQMQYEEEQTAAAVQPEDTVQLPQQPVSVSLDIYNTANIQAVLAESMKELMQEEVSEDQEAFTVRVEEEREDQEPLKSLEDEVQKEEIMPEEEKEQEKPEEKKTAAGVLSEERKQIFAAFLHINGLEEQLAEIFDEAERSGEERMTSLSGNVLVIGDHKSGKTTLATELMKSLNKAADRRGRKIAKISGDRLNNKGIKETIAHLTGADLLVERAGEMNRATMQELLEAMAGYTGGMLVVLEDTEEGMTHLIAENPEMEVCFTHRLILKEYEISEWVALAKQYAEEYDYGIDEMGVLALSAKIDSLYAQKTVVDMDDIKDIIDVAIEHSERKNIKRLFETVFSGKYKDSDLTMLRENDFR